MRTVLILGLMLLAVIFAVQNAEVVSVDFLFWNLNASPAVLAALCITQLAELDLSMASQTAKAKFQSDVAARE